MHISYLWSLEYWPRTCIRPIGRFKRLGLKLPLVLVGHGSQITNWNSLIIPGILVNVRVGKIGTFQNKPHRRYSQDGPGRTDMCPLRVYHGQIRCCTVQGHWKLYTTIFPLYPGDGNARIIRYMLFNFRPFLSTLQRHWPVDNWQGPTVPFTRYWQCVWRHTGDFLRPLNGGHDLVLGGPTGTFKPTWCLLFIV